MGGRQSSCAACGTAAKGPIKFSCAVCSRKHCRQCCKRYASLAAAPERQVRLCNACFTREVIWDASTTRDVLGPPGGRPVLLVHGALAGRQCLVHEARALAAAGFRVIVPDLPAHGARWADDAPLTLASAVACLTEAAKLEAPGQKVVAMGFSMGGYVAAALAAAHPELIAGVVLGGCAHDTTTWGWAAMGRLADCVYACVSYKTKSGFIVNSSPSMDPARPEIQEAFLRAGAEFDAWPAAWRVMAAADMRHLLPRITCPALLAVGERDFRSHERLWLSLLRRGRLLVLPGGEHAFMLQPGVAEVWRAEALAFAEAADWGEVGAPPSAAAADQAADAAGPGAAAGTGTGTGPRVGLGAVFSSLWAQRHARQRRPAPRDDAAATARA